jgi:putative hydrolase of the HAD superfamily
MKTPKMIIFDYGQTLLCEPGYDSLRGQRALFQYVKSNKNNLTPEQASDFSGEIFEKIGTARKAGLELHDWQLLKFVYEYLEIELSVSYAEAEKILWDNKSPGAVMPNADRMIDYINANGIRSGVISNIGWSGAALADRINRLLPQNKFEFIIASSEYMFRKPNPMLFEIALKKAGLDAGDVWYCGDKVKYDVEGAAAAGIFPVWYEDQTMENTWLGDEKDIVPQCEHLHIHDWNELITLLEGLK